VIPDAFNFRVPCGPDLPLMHFETLADATAYARSCLDADRVEFLHADGFWREIWHDGEMVYTRPGFAVLVPYRAGH
jgi:hypothetical protein